MLVDESPTIIRTAAGDWGEGSREEISALIKLVDSPDYLPFFRQYIASGFDGTAPDAILDQMSETAAALPPYRAAALLTDATEQDFREISARSAEQLPILQVVRRDWAEAAQRWIAANQPKARVAVLGGHMMLYEYAQAFNSAVLSFLQDS